MIRAPPAEHTKSASLATDIIGAARAGRRAAKKKPRAGLGEGLRSAGQNGALRLGGGY